MPRPKSDNPRRRQLNVHFTDAEFEIARRRAEATGLVLIEFARHAILHQKLLVQEEAMPSTEKRLILENLKRIGNNLNQLARAANSMQIVASDELAAALTEVRAIINRDLK